MSGPRSPLSGARSAARHITPVTIAAAWLLVVSAAHAQDRRTQAPCSPVIEGVQGDVTVTFSGGCTVGVAPAELKQIVESVLAGRAIPPELLDDYKKISGDLRVTDTALTKFFRILGENKVPIEDLDAKLREIAARHLVLLKQAEPSLDDDPRVAEKKKEAFAAITAVDYGRAETLLQQAFDDNLAAARSADQGLLRAQDVRNRRYLAAAKTKADFGELKLTQLQYAAALEAFREAAGLVPATEPLVRAGYLNSLGMTAFRAANFPLAERALSEALRIREANLSPEHLRHCRQPHQLRRIAAEHKPAERGGAALQARSRDLREVLRT